MRIVIVDYGLGNLKSVYNALRSLGADVEISSSASSIDNADKLILPGVGAFGDAMEGLRKRNLIESVKKFIFSGSVYLGLCLGLQILFEMSEEGNAKGLGIFKGKVVRLKEKKGLKIPHMGWNQLKLKAQSSKLKIFNNIPDGSDFYFVHSYYVQPKDKGIVAATTKYGEEFVSMIKKDNIYATQFHPEKSQSIGLRFLKNFIDL